MRPAPARSEDGACGKCFVLLSIMALAAAKFRLRRNPYPMSTTYVPTISSGTAGPLGVLHLPRLWQKVSLESQGKLAEGYPGIGHGYDMMVIEALGLSADAVRAFITASKPTYPEFEAWVKSQPGVKLDQATIDQLNGAIKGYIHKDEVRAEVFAANGLTDADCPCRDAVNLNNLDDWFGFHAAVLK